MSTNKIYTNFYEIKSPERNRTCIRFLVFQPASLVPKIILRWLILSLYKVLDSSPCLLKKLYLFRPKKDDYCYGVFESISLHVFRLDRLKNHFSSLVGKSRESKYKRKHCYLGEIFKTLTL